MSDRVTQHKAWAVVVTYPERSFIAGRYWFNPNSDSVCQTALFRTRSDARKAIAPKRHWSSPRMKPVRVRVTVEVVEPAERPILRSATESEAKVRGEVEL